MGLVLSRNKMVHRPDSQLGHEALPGGQELCCGFLPLALGSRNPFNFWYNIGGGIFLHGSSPTQRPKIDPLQNFFILLTVWDKN